MISTTEHDQHDEHAPGFWRKYIFSTDHKVIGIQYILTGIFMALVGGGLAMVMRIQLTWPGMKMPLMETLFPAAFPGGILTPEAYLSIITMHGTIMVFFVISLALVSGLGNYLIPLQLGAKDMAYPFLNMLSYWTVVPACLIMILSFFVEGGAAASGWTAYPPLSAVPEAVPGSQFGQTLWLLGMALFIVSFPMGSLNFVVTILNCRIKGMTLMRLPITIWTYFISAILGLLTFPPLTAAAIMLLFDRHFGTSFFVPGGLVIGGNAVDHMGGTPLLWQHLFWFLGHPEVYVLILPALGLTFDVLAAFTRKPIFGYRLMVVCLLIIAVLSVIVWGHHMYVSGMNPFLGEFFTIGTLLITIPSAVIGLCYIASLWGGSVRLTSPMLFALGVVILFGSGGFGGIFLGNATSDIFLHDSYFVVGHFHLMIGGVTLFATLAAIYHWFPKMFGRKLNECIGKLHFWLSITSFYVIFLIMHFQGLDGTPRRYYDYSKFEILQPLLGYQFWISMASFAFGAASLLFIFNVIWSLARSPKADENPWNATTLEWTTVSPPPHGNWPDTAPCVHRWAYDYSVPGADDDATPQSVPAESVPVTR